MTKELWPHQVHALELVRAEAKKGKRAICLVMSTGAGKTYTGGAFASRHLDKQANGKVLWVAHRDILVEQAYDDLSNEWGLSCGVIQAKPTRIVNPFRPVQIGMAQTLLARENVPEGITFAVFDEIHHYASDKWSKLVLSLRKAGAFILGLTATPIRTDGRGLGDIEDV